jgi:hypothetical protein
VLDLLHGYDIHQCKARFAVAAYENALR